jgi:hypothetical protein
MKQGKEHAEALASISNWLPLARSSLPVTEELLVDKWSEPEGFTHRILVKPCLT